MGNASTASKKAEVTVWHYGLIDFVTSEMGPGGPARMPCYQMGQANLHGRARDLETLSCRKGSATTGWKMGSATYFIYMFDR